MVISNELVISLVAAVLASPVVTGVIQRRPAKRTEKKIGDVLNEVEKVAHSLRVYQTEEALKDFYSKTIKIVNGNSGGVTIEEWITSRSTLQVLLPEANWPASLVEESRKAQDIIRHGGLHE